MEKWIRGLRDEEMREGEDTRKWRECGNEMEKEMQAEER